MPPAPLPSGETNWDAFYNEDRVLRFAGTDDRLVLALGHRATELWSLEPLERIAQLDLPGEVPVTALDVGADGTLVATGDESGWVAVWSARTGEPLQGPIEVSGRVTALHLDPSGGRLAIGAESGRAYVLARADGSLRALEHGVEHDSDGACIEEVRFDPSGETLVTLAPWGRPQVCAWDPDSGRLLWRYGGRLTRGIARFSPDGERLFLSARGIVLDARTGAVLYATFPATGTPLTLDSNGFVAWSLDGDRLSVFTFNDRVAVRDLRITDPGDRAGPR